VAFVLFHEGRRRTKRARVAGDECCGGEV
jgi:hypothetical protein